MIRANPNHPSAILLELQLLQTYRKNSLASLPRCKTKYVPTKKHVMFDINNNIQHPDEYTTVHMNSVKENHIPVKRVSFNSPLTSSSYVRMPTPFPISSSTPTKMETRKQTRNHKKRAYHNKTRGIKKVKRV